MQFERSPWTLRAISRTDCDRCRHRHQSEQRTDLRTMLRGSAPPRPAEALDDQPGHGAQLSPIRRSGDQISPSRSAGRRFRPNGDNSAQRFDRKPRKATAFVWKREVDFPKRRRAAVCIHSVSNLYTKTANRLEQSEAVFFATFSQFCHNNSRKLRFLQSELRQMSVCGNSGTHN